MRYFSWAVRPLQNGQMYRIIFPATRSLTAGSVDQPLPDVIRYAGQVIYPYQPKEIVIYCGENDVASSDTVTAQIVFERFKQLFGMIRTNLQNKSCFISLAKPFKVENAGQGYRRQ